MNERRSEHTSESSTGSIREWRSQSSGVDRSIFRNKGQSSQARERDPFVLSFPGFAQKDLPCLGLLSLSIMFFARFYDYDHGVSSLASYSDLWDGGLLRISSLRCGCHHSLAVFCPSVSSNHRRMPSAQIK